MTTFSPHIFFAWRNVSVVIFSRLFTFYVFANTCIFCLPSTCALSIFLIQCFKSVFTFFCLFLESWSFYSVICRALFSPFVSNSSFSSLLFISQQRKQNVSKPYQKGWLARLSHNATRMVVSNLNNAGDQQGTVGAWTNMALKYLVLKSEGNQTAARKVT